MDLNLAAILLAFLFHTSPRHITRFVSFPVPSRDHASLRLYLHGFSLPRVPFLRRGSFEELLCSLFNDVAGFLLKLRLAD